MVKSDSAIRQYSNTVLMSSTDFSNHCRLLSLADHADELRHEPILTTLLEKKR